MHNDQLFHSPGDKTVLEKHIDEIFQYFPGSFVNQIWPKVKLIMGFRCSKAYYNSDNRGLLR